MKSLLLFFVFFCAGCSLLHASETDSLQIALRKKTINEILASDKTNLQDSILADYYLELASYASSDFDYNLAISYCDSILQSCKGLPFERLKEVEERKATLLRADGKSGEGIKILLDILKEYESKQRYYLSAGLNRRIGTIFLKMDDYANAEYHLNESIANAKKVNDSETEAYALMSLGNRFKNEGRYEEAKNRYLASIAIAEKIENQRILAGNYNNFGSLLRMMKDVKGAKKFYKKAVEINKATGNDKWLSYNYNNLGNIAEEEGDDQEALRYFLLSIEMKDRLGDLRGKVLTLANIADSYKRLGNYKKAFEYQKEYSAVRDSVDKMNNMTENKRLAAQFQSEKRDAEIKALNLQDKYNQQKIEGQNAQISYQSMIAWILGIGIVLLLFIAVLLYRTTLNRKRINAELVVKNEQIDRQHREILDSINYASRIQNSILPGNEQRKKLLPEHAILFRPKDIISGDFYVCDAAGENIYFGTVDCTGHGVPGAMVSLVASSFINKMIHEYNLSDPGSILTRLNQEIPDALNNSEQAVNDGMDMALCVMNPGAMQMKFSGAYQNCWILASVDSLQKRNHPDLNATVHQVNDFAILELKGERRGIGRSSLASVFSAQTIELAKGDMIVLATDGYQDQFGGPKNKKFMVKELRNLVLQQAGASPDQIVNTLDTTLKDWMATTDQVDDVCVFVVRV